MSKMLFWAFSSKMLDVFQVVGKMKHVSFQHSEKIGEIMEKGECILDSKILLP